MFLHRLIDDCMQGGDFVKEVGIPENEAGIRGLKMLSVSYIVKVFDFFLIFVKKLKFFLNFLRFSVYRIYFPLIFLRIKPSGT